MKIFSCSLFCLFCYLLPYTANALDEKSREELFPLQPSLVYQVRESFINPFTMASYSLGLGLNAFDIHYRYQVPYYLDKVTFGVDIRVMDLGALNMNTLRMLREGYTTCRNYDVGPIQLLSYTLSTIPSAKVLHTLSMTMDLKLPLLMNSNIGSLALTVSPKIGPLIDMRQEPFSNIGIAPALGFGLEWYWGQWWGMYLENTSTYRYFIYPKENLGFSHRLTVGFKSTF